MNNSITKTFFKTTYSVSQARARLRLLRDYLIDYLFAPPNDNLLTSQVKDVRPAGSDKDPWLKSLGEEFYNEFSHENVYQKLKVLEETISDSEPLVMYMAFDMPDDEINKLGPWMRKNIMEDILFDIKIDPTLMGGCAFSWHGIFKDYSLRAKVAQNHDKILANIKSTTK